MTCTSCSTELAPRATFCPSCGHRVEDPLIGTTLDGRYRIEERIAVGGFGSIYRGTQIAISRPIAIKVMHQELAADASLVARFRREGAVLCSLRDAHTVTTYELGEADGSLYIVMELLDGKNLLEVFQATGKMSWQRVLGIAGQVCSALAEAHALGIIHRDLKPANIFLETRHGNTDFVKVLDFGIAKILQASGIHDGTELTMLGQAVGTLEYMAPEQLMGGKCDGRTDIYTLGVVAFEMITGRRPHTAAGLELLSQQLSQKPPVPSQLARMPRTVDPILLDCLEPDVERRWADVGALAKAIEELLEVSAKWKPAITAVSSPPPVPEADTLRDLEMPKNVEVYQRKRWNPVIVIVLLAVLGAAVGVAIAWAL